MSECFLFANCSENEVNMAGKKYKYLCTNVDCTNFDKCRNGADKVVIEFNDDGDHECDKPEGNGHKLLKIVSPNHSFPPWIRVVAAIVIIFAIVLVAFKLIKQSNPVTPNVEIEACALAPAKDVDVAKLIQYLKQGLFYAEMNRPEDALSEFEHGLLIDKNFLGLNANKAQALLKLKRYDEAKSALNKELELIRCMEMMSDDELKDYAYMLEVEEKIETLRPIEQAKKLRTRFGLVRAVSQYNLACLHSLKEEKALALDALNKAVESGFNDKRSLAEDPDLAFIRSDPAFTKILQELK
jgi:hypothetical protein